MLTTTSAILYSVKIIKAVYAINNLIYNYAITKLYVFDQFSNVSNRKTRLLKYNIALSSWLFTGNGLCFTHEIYFKLQILLLRQ